MKSDGVTRRWVLRAMGAGAVGMAGRGLWGQTGETRAVAKAAVGLKVRAFDLADVRLLPGPFLAAQERDEKYLLSLEPDRLLHNFHVNAGLAAKAPVYGGWESVGMWANIRAHGHTLGHYLTACAMMFASTGKAAFKDRVDYLVAELQRCQATGKPAAGLVCAFPDGAAQFENMLAGRAIVGVPWYTMHKIFAGLRDAHVCCGSAAALDVLGKLSDWAIAATAGLSDPAFEKMLNVEHGGMNEVLADVYALTGQEKYLALAKRFCHRAVLEPLAAGRDTLDKLHSNTQIPKFIGFARLFELTGGENFGAAARFFWKTVVEKRSFVMGGNGDNEHFFPVGEFAAHLSSAKTMETCCSHNMLKLSRQLFLLDPSATYADYYERTLYNMILASQDPDSGMFTYFQATRPGYMKLYCTPVDSFWCCTGTGMENHAKYGDSIYFHTDDALVVNLFVPSTLAWKERGVTVTQRTNFPDEGRTRIEVTAARAGAWTMRVRQPGWCAAMAIKVNGVAVTPAVVAGYAEIGREWKAGDVVEVELPMQLKAVGLPGAADRVAVMVGPIVLAGKLGNAGMKPGADLIVNERTYGQVMNEAVEVPVVKGEILSKVKAGAGALEYELEAMKGGEQVAVALVPYFRVAHERYNVYWAVG